jgi:hypothetical protein
VSIAAAAATAAYIPLSAAAAVHVPLSAALAVHTPRSAAPRLFSRNTSENADVIENTLEYYATPRTIKITSLGESPTFGLMTSLPVTSFSVTSHPVAMLPWVISNGTFCTTTIVRKIAQECTSGHAQNILPVMTSLPVM